MSKKSGSRGPDFRYRIKMPQRTFALTPNVDHAYFHAYLAQQNNDFTARKKQEEEPP